MRTIYLGSEMKKQIMRLSSLSVMLACPIVLSTVAEAGSHNGNIEQASSFNCDARISLKDNFESWCTLQNAKLIQSTCYAVIHAEPIQRCGWQGCGHISFVGSKPTIAGSQVKEYGISTPHGMASIPASWQPSGSSVLPKAPFPRVYLTVGQFVTVKENCSKNQPFIDSQSTDRICTSNEKTLELNPYYYCMRHHKVVP